MGGKQRNIGGAKMIRVCNYCDHETEYKATQGEKGGYWCTICDKFVPVRSVPDGAYEEPIEEVMLEEKLLKMKDCMKKSC